MLFSEFLFGVLCLKQELIFHAILGYFSFFILFLIHPNFTSFLSHTLILQDFVFKSLIGTCFPGCDVPAWFNHQAFGSVLKLEFPRDWNEGKLNGIALCCAVSFKDYKDQNNGLQVKCTSEFTNVSSSRESFTIGGWSEPGDEPHTIETDHIFVGYTTLFNSKKRQQFTSGTEVSLTFEVTNGMSGVEGCKVMKCGFTLVYEPEEAENLGGAISHAPLRTRSFAKGRGYLSWNRD